MRLLVIIICLFFSVSAYSGQDDIHIVSQTQKHTGNHYTVLDAKQYHRTVHTARLKIQKILHALQFYRVKDADTQVGFIAQQLENIPYIYTGAMGEGDWQPTSATYRPGAVHIKQDPVYRLDGLDCQTFVQMAMALLY